MAAKKLTIREIEKQYEFIKDMHKKHLSAIGVKLPSLKRGKQLSLNALVLVYLSLDYPNTRVVTKEELTEFVRQYFPNINDVQQGRHLGAQAGFYIAAGGRDDFEQLSRGTYKLVTLERPYPGFTKERRQNTISDWDSIKQEYQYRCATCGSKEGEANFMWPNAITKLQKAHMDPQLELSSDNVIPQCQKCNQADRNRWVYDKKGRVIKLADASVIKACSEEVQYEVYRLLYKKYGGKKPGSDC